jgi:hypothetical protein
VLSSIEEVKRLLASRTPAFLFAREGNKLAEICDLTTNAIEIGKSRTLSTVERKILSNRRTNLPF